MKKLLFLVLLGCPLLGFAQQPAVTPKPTAPAKPSGLTEKQLKQLEEARQQQIEFARRQREYELEQADKERKKAEKKAEKERLQREKEAAKVTPPQPTPAPPTVSPATPTPTEPAVVKPEKTKPSKPAKVKETKLEETPVLAKPTEPKPERPKREKREKAPKVEVVTPVETAPVEPVVTAPVASKPAKPKRVKAAKVSTPGAQLSAPDTVASSTPRREFLPKGHSFDPIRLDPIEAQTYGSVLPSYTSEGNRYNGTIVPFAFGLIKPFYRKTLGQNQSNEWALDVASFTQFEVYYDDVKGKQRRQIMNTDYRVGFHYNIRRGANSWRFRLYHLSSHLGDDYLIRNGLGFYRPNPVNYEQIDVTYSRDVIQTPGLRYYGGIGFTLRKAEERKLLAGQAGLYYRRPSFFGTSAVRPVSGIDVKVWQQTDFRPGIHAGAGVEVGRAANNLTFLIEYYNGFRPYSEYESQRTQWIGIGVYFNPI